MNHKKIKLLYVIFPLILLIGISIFPISYAHPEKDEAPILPQWLEDAAIDVEEAIKEILEKRDS